MIIYFPPITSQTTLLANIFSWPTPNTIVFQVDRSYFSLVLPTYITAMAYPLHFYDSLFSLVSGSYIFKLHLKQGSQLVDSLLKRLHFLSLALSLGLSSLMVAHAEARHRCQSAVAVRGLIPFWKRLPTRLHLLGGFRGHS